MKFIKLIHLSISSPILVLFAFLIIYIFTCGIPLSAQTLNYNSLSLDDCVSLARKNNPVLGASRAKIRELEADYRAVRSSYFPQISLSSHYTRLDPGLQWLGPKYNYEVFGGLSIKQSLFDGLSTYYNTQASKLGVQSQKEETQKTEDEVMFNVTSAFCRLLESKENLKVTEDALKQRRSFLAITGAFFKAGKGTRLDFLRAGSQASDAEQAKIESEYAIRLAKEILRRTLGLEEKVVIDIQNPPVREIIAAGNIEDLWQVALQNNPEIKALNMEIEQNRSLIKAARAGYFPDVSIQGSSGYRQRNMGTKPEWLAGIFAEYPLFEGGATKAKVDKASSRELQLLEIKRDRLDAIKVDLVSAWKDMESARRGIETSSQIVSTNEEAYASAEGLYRYGKVTALDVLQAQADLTASRFRLIQYRVIYELAQARIKQIISIAVLSSLHKNSSEGPKK
jgi:outer membrane protein